MGTVGLIVAAGRGNRLGGALPKQYQRIGSETVLGRAMTALLAHPGIERLLVVIHPDDAAHYAAVAAEIADPRLLPPVHGAEDRRGSVLNGLQALAEHAPDRVLIHDAARPFLPPAVTGHVLEALDLAPAACPALPVVDALWCADGEGHAAEPVPREGLWRAQTPQGFHFAPILAAHRAYQGPAPDDVTVARAEGLTVRLVPGDERNFKITTAEDLAKARRIMEGAMDIRIGNGFDAHRFGPGDSVTLCGVQIPFEQGLVGHSDADVGLHAITDAVFGALAEGDIGQWFSPTDPRWKGAASDIFLHKAMERARARGFAVTHIDATLICEAPKIGPHSAAMRSAIARITGIDPERISVKATTTERLGFIGRGEGIAAMATATLVRA